jgi:hypothetical protein
MTLPADSGRRARTGTRALVTCAALGLVLAAPAATAVAQQRPKILARGLDNPRGITIGPDGRLYVAESGRGGSGPCMPGPEGGTVCFGRSGAITRIDPRGGRQRRIVSRLPSLGRQQTGAEAIGVSDISFSRRREAFVTVGLGANPSVRPTLPGAAGAGMAKLYRMRMGGSLRAVADLGAFEATRNPDNGQPGALPDTNPNSVDASGRGPILVADAGGNDVLAVTPSGRISVLAVFPFGTGMAPDGSTIPVQPVPTSVTRFGRDVYAGQLTGFPFPAGGASVWRVMPGAAPQVRTGGLTQITDIAFGRDRSLYVVEYATRPLAGPPSPGALIRLRPNGTMQELAAGTLRQATGVAVDRRFAYVSNRGAEAGRGQVVRIRLPRR